MISARVQPSSQPLRLSLSLLLLQGLPLPGRRLHLCFDTLGSLPRLVQLATLHDALYDVARVDVLERVGANLAEDAHGLGRRVGVVRQGDEGRRSVVDGCGRAEGEGVEVGFCRREGSAEDDAVDVL